MPFTIRRLAPILAILAGAFSAPMETHAQESALPTPGVLENSGIVEPTAPVVNLLLRFGAKMAPDDGIQNGEPCAFDCGADANMEGPFVFVRDWLRQIAFILILPLAIVTVLTAMLTSRSGLEHDLGKLVIRILVVALVLRWYHVWDQAIWYGVTVPSVRLMQHGPMVDHLIRTAVTDDSGALPSGVSDDDFTPTSATDDMNSRLVQQATGPLQTTVKGEIQMDEAAAKNCTISAEQTIVCSRKISSWLGEEMDVSTLTEAERPSICPADRGLMYCALMVASNPIQFAGNAVITLVTKKLQNMATWLQRSIIGALITIQNLMVSVIMWFVWLAAIFSRAMSLTLAPIAIAFSLLPNGEHRLMTWFKKHAGLALMPAAVAFGFLLYYAFVISIMANSPGLITLGMQFAAFFIIPILAWKMKDLLNGIANDATEVAGQFGKAATEAVAKGAVVAVGAATGGASAALSGAATTAASSTGGAGTDAPDAGKADVRAQQAHDSMLRGTENEAAEGTGAGSRIAKATSGVKAGTKAVARSAWRAGRDKAVSSFTGSRYGKLFTDTASSIAGDRPNFLKTSGELDEERSNAEREAARARQEAGRRMVARTPDVMAAEIQKFTTEINERAERAEKEGTPFPKFPTLRKHESRERLYNATQAEIEDALQEIEEGEREAVRDALQHLREVERPLMQFKMVDGQRVGEITEQTAAGIIQLIKDNPEFAAKYAEYGDAVAADLINVDGKEIHNPHQVVARSNELGQAMTLRAYEYTAEMRELQRRDYASAVLNHRPGFVGDIMIREMDPEIYDTSLDPHDPSGYTLRFGEALLRVAAARASGDTRPTKQLVADLSLDQLVPSAWEQEEAFDKMTPEEAKHAREHMQKAYDEMATAFRKDIPLPGPVVQWRNYKFGVDRDRYLVSLGQDVLLKGGLGSDFTQEVYKVAAKRKDDPDMPQPITTQIAFKNAYPRAVKQVKEIWERRGQTVPSKDSPEFAEFRSEVLIHLFRSRVR